MFLVEDALQAEEFAQRQFTCAVLVACGVPLQDLGASCVNAVCAASSMFSFSHVFGGLLHGLPSACIVIAPCAIWSGMPMD